jgi:signal transduction histidine kinase
MREHRSQFILSIIVCVSGCTLLLIVQRSLAEPVGGMLASFVYLATILLAGVIGGWRTAFATTILGLLVALFLFSPPYWPRVATNRTDLLRLALFVTIGMALSGLSGLLHLSWKRIEERQSQLAKAHQFLQSTLNALSAMIVVLDEQGNILATNDAWKQFAIDQQQMECKCGVGNNYLETCQMSVAPEMVTGLREVLTGRRKYFEFEYQSRSSTDARWFLMRATPFPVPGPTRVVVAHEEITQRKSAEMALKEADRRKDEFLATLAHELRNPLAPICNGLEIIKMAEGDPATIDPLCDMIERQLSQVLHLVNDLLDVSRIRQGKIELRKQHVPLSKIIELSVETSRPSIESAGHELKVDVPSDQMIVDADLARMAQVFSNLLNNAAKYTEPSGKIWLHVDRAEDQVTVTVGDNGIGIPPEMLPRIFDVFTQIDHHVERSRDGLGIGLSIVKRLVEMHGGTVGVRSAGPQKGSEFVVQLPIVCSELSPTDAAA